MNEQYHKYTVVYSTTPSPGLTYYEGTVMVVARDDEEAGEEAKKQLSRRALIPYSCIRVREITRKNY